MNRVKLASPVPAEAFIEDKKRKDQKIRMFRPWNFAMIFQRFAVILGGGFLSNPQIFFYLKVEIFIFHINFFKS